MRKKKDQWKQKARSHELVGSDKLTAAQRQHYKNALIGEIDLKVPDICYQGNIITVGSC